MVNIKLMVWQSLSRRLQGNTTYGPYVVVNMDLIICEFKINNTNPSSICSSFFQATKKYKTPEVEKYLSPDDIGRAVVYAVTQPIGVSVNEILIEPTDYPI